MPEIRIRDAAHLLGVSDDTVRRWVDAGTLDAHKDDAGRMVVDGRQLAEFARTTAAPASGNPLGAGSSARNRFVGLVTRVEIDGVMAQVELQCGPFAVVSLMTADSARELNLEPGSVGVAVVKSTTVIVETPGALS